MTRIASVATHMISVPRPPPVWTAHEQSKAWNVILTEVRTDDGLVGYGEIHGAPMPRIASGSADLVKSSAAWTRWLMLRCGRSCSR
jgi:L-alanine-DL-glutamate epimerase-like enolase superfamily enzyme